LKYQKSTKVQNSYSIPKVQNSSTSSGYALLKYGLAVDFAQDKEETLKFTLNDVGATSSYRSRAIKKPYRHDLTKCSTIIAKVQVISRPRFRSRL